MTIEHFLKLRPYLYHLTHQNNVPIILESGRLESTVRLTERVQLADRDNFCRQRRGENVTIQNDTLSVVIRDQAQIIEDVLRRSLEPNCTYEQFIELLNSKVFFWPTQHDVIKHYGTYQAERPRVLRFNTSEVLALNQAPKFCKLNSGAPRCHPAYRPNAAPRGLNTFQLAANYGYAPSTVREVTFEHVVLLPETYWIAENPAGAFTEGHR